MDLERIQKTAAALSARNMEAFCAETSEEAVALLQSFLREGDSVGHGGSVTLSELGVPELLKNGPYVYLDRDACQTPEEREACMRSILNADVFLTSANAITEDGVLYNVDGNGNRVAALCYGPKRVIVIAGTNKIVKDLPEAVRRVKTKAAPLNGVRLQTSTYCAVQNKCVAAEGAPCDGCGGTARMCCDYVATGYQRDPERLKVILVNAPLGY